jgi:hypothetical protein
VSEEKISGSGALLSQPLPEALRASTLPQGEGGSFAKIAALAIVCCCTILPAHAGDSVTTSTANGFARLLFTLAPTAHVTANADGGVLTIGFDRKVALDPAAMVQSAPGYITSVRIDADGKTFRLALAQPMRVHSSASGDRIAIDLAPASFLGTPPDLPPPSPQKPGAAIDPAKLDTPCFRARASLRSGSRRWRIPISPRS